MFGWLFGKKKKTQTSPFLTVSERKRIDDIHKDGKESVRIVKRKGSCKLSPYCKCTKFRPVEMLDDTFNWDMCVCGHWNYEHNS